MEPLDKPVLIYATFPDRDRAEAVARDLVDMRLAACVNILDGGISIYRWEGELQRDSECVAIIKTTAALAERVLAEGRARHPYENPAFLILPVEGGSASYLSWLLEEVQTPRAPRG